jgi:hypothetical protein
VKVQQTVWAILAVCALAVTPSAAPADVISGSLFKTGRFTQTGSSITVLAQYDFNADVSVTDPADFTSITGSGPASFTLGQNSTDFHFSSVGFPSQANLDGAFPDGSYSFDLEGGNLGPDSAVIALDGDHYPGAVPLFSASTYSGAAHYDSSGAQTLTWNSFPTDVSVDEQDVFLAIFDSHAQVVLNVALPASATSYNVPAHTLSPGQSYDAVLYFSNRTLGADFANLAPTIAGYDFSTLLAVTTVPEPGMTLGIVAGLLTLGALRLPRRRGRGDGAQAHADRERAPVRGSADRAQPERSRLTRQSRAEKPWRRAKTSPAQRSPQPEATHPVWNRIFYQRELAVRAQDINRMAVSVLMLLSIPSVPAMANPYAITFTTSSGVAPTSGSFDYDPTNGFSNFLVTWNGITYDLTSSANTVPDGTPEIVFGLDRPALSFAVLSQTLGEATSYYWEAADPGGIVSNYFDFHAPTSSTSVTIDGEKPPTHLFYMTAGTGTWQIIDLPEPSKFVLRLAGLAGMGFVTLWKKHRRA